jgi:N-acetylneuraminic acid mutarotase
MRILFVELSFQSKPLKNMERRISSILSLSSALIGLLVIFLSDHTVRAGSWTTNSPMNNARHSHTATLLQNGKVLVTGGFNPGNSAELFDPATGTWTVTGPMSVARWFHTATLLTNGQVLIVGGRTQNQLEPLYSAELYNPATGTWTTTGSLNIARASHTAPLLQNGKVLVTGGWIGESTSNDSGILSSAELFDPATGIWTLTNPLTTGRAYHAATLLSNGQVLLTGGIGTNSVLASTELFDPPSGTWSPGADMQIGRDSHTATLLPNGTVLLAGGYNGGYQIGILSDAELYDPTIDSWKTTGALNAAREQHTATLLPNGQVLVAGGDGDGYLSSVEVYDPAAGTWSTNNPLNTARNGHTATLLANGKVLVAGGKYLITSPIVGYLITASVEVYDPGINPATGTNTLIGMMITRRADHQAILLPNGKVLVAGGMNDISPFQSAELFSPSNGAWAATGSMTQDRGWGFTLTLLPNGMALATGGYAYSSGIYDSELYNPTNGTWTGIFPTVYVGNILQTATLLLNGKVLVAGGVSQGASYNLPSAHLFNPGTRTWTVTGAMQTPRYGHAATLLLNGKVLVEGGIPISSSTGAATNSAELYDPVSGTWTNTGAMNGAHYDHTATLLPDGKVLVAGGSDHYNSAGTNSAELYDPVSGTWSYTGAMNVARTTHSATFLPSGKVMVAGGVGTNSLSVPGLYECLSSVELYDPATGTWVLTSGLNIARNGHTATLLPNGKVLIAGGFNSHFSYPTDFVSSAELYDAGIGYSNAWRPRITAVTSPLNLGGSLVVTGAQFRGIAEGSSGNTQDSSADYPLVQLRSLESGQTTFLLTTNWSTNSVASSAVWNFPPGWALATVFVNGIQSTSSIVNISVPVPAPTILACTAPTNGAFQFCFTNNPGALFGVLMTTNLSLPLANWTRLGGVAEVAPGQFQFTDPQAASSGQHFYSIYAP